VECCADLKRLLLVIASAASVAHAAPPALVFAGDADPSGADEALLALGRARGMTVTRERVGNLAEEPRARLQKAVEAFARLQLADARARFDALESEVAATGGLGLTRGELIELFATRATMRVTAGNDGGAWDDLLQVAAFSPARPLDPARFPPRVLELERRATEALAAGGKLTVTTTPGDAALFVDGLAAGRELVVPAGRHFVRAERAGFEGAGRTVEVTPAGASVSLALSPRAAPPMEMFRGPRVVGAWIGARDGAAVLELAHVRDGRVSARTSVTLGPRLTEPALAAALELLVPPESTAPRKPVYKRAWFWGVIGGAAAAAALAVGLGVGLGGGHVDGYSVRVGLGGTR
jgi:hypothetical protein